MSRVVFDRDGLTIVEASNGTGKGRRLELNACRDVVSLSPEFAAELGSELRSWSKREERRQRSRLCLNCRHKVTNHDERGCACQRGGGGRVMACSCIWHRSELEARRELREDPPAKNDR